MSGATVSSATARHTILAVAVAVFTLACHSVDFIGTSVNGVTPPAAVLVTADEPQVYVYHTVRVHAVTVSAAGDTLPPSNLVWSSSDSTTATVSVSGVVTGMRAGAVTITAIVDSSKGSVALTVLDAPVAKIVVAPAADTLYPRDVAQLTVSEYDDLGHLLPLQPVTWASSNPTAAEVSSSGLVTALDTGRADVTASIANVVGGASILVIPHFTVARVVTAPRALGIGTFSAGKRVTATALDASGALIPWVTVSWVSRDENVAFVNPNGDTNTVYPWDPGETNVVASTAGHSDSIHVLVGTCAPTQAIDLNNFYLPVEAGGQWNNSAVAPSGLYRTNPTLNNSGVAFGTDGAHLALGTNITGTWDTGDIAQDSVCAYQTAAMHRTLVDLTVAPGVGLDSLDVVQETWAFPDPASPTSSYVLVRYAFTNESAQALQNFYAAYLADWDIQDLNGFADPAHNLVRYDSTLGVGEATGADTVNYPAVFGVVPVAAGGAMNFKGWANGTGTLGDPQTDADIFAYLSAGIDTTVPSTATDIRELMGVGPVTIPPRGRFVVYFGVLGADNQAAFNQAVPALRAKAQSLGF